MAAYGKIVAMLQDFERIENPVPGLPGQEKANVCILGAGAAGILLATQLAEQGLSVLLLEAGGLDLESRSQEIYRTELEGHSYQGTTRGRFRTLGGSTTQWGGQLLELEDFDFEPRKHVKGSGWPIRKVDLAPFYERALQFAGLRRVEREDHRVWAGLGLSICDLGPEFRMEYSRWCPERDFAVLQRAALRDSRRLQGLYHANVLGFVLNDTRSAIAGVRVRGYESTDAVITADRYVLAMGGIETNRLLLQTVDGGGVPWQRNGLLGQHFQDHISLNGIPIRDISMQPVARYFGYRTLNNFLYHNKIRLSLEEQVKARSLNVAGTIGPWRKEDPARDAAIVMLREVVRKGRRPSAAAWAEAARSFPGIGWEVISQRLLGGREGGGPEWNRLMLTVHAEQSPRSASAITLTDQRDAVGMLRAKVDWRISDLELVTLRAYVKRAMEVFAARRFAKVAPPQGFFEDDALVRSMCTDSYHHMGGTRMSSDARTGIVDADLKVHGVANLYVCSSSVFPTGGFSNPTLTILALAMRLGDHLRAKTVGDGVRLPRPLARVQPMRQIELPILPSAAKLTPQLGFGCSYLLGPNADRGASRRLLNAAYDAGIRHFDTARLYSQGEGEALLGEFLREHPDATVTTKFGMEPPNSVQRLISAAGRQIGPLQGAAKLLRGSGKAELNAANAQASLERSLRALGRERVEVFLLHEPEPQELRHDDLLRFLEIARTEGKIGTFGIGGEFRRVGELYETRRSYAPVLQFEHSVFSPELSLPETRRIHYRTFARPAAALNQALGDDPQLAWWWSEMVGADLQEPSVVSRLLLRASLDQHPESLTLFSTTHEDRIYGNVTVAEDSHLIEPAGRLVKLIRENELGIGAALYGKPDL